MFTTFKDFTVLPTPLSKLCSFPFSPPTLWLLFLSPTLWETATSFIKWLHFIALLSFLIIRLLPQPSWELIEGKKWELELFQVIFFQAPGHPRNWFIYFSPPRNLLSSLSSTSLKPQNSMWQPVKGNTWPQTPLSLWHLMPSTVRLMYCLCQHSSSQKQF